MIAKIILFLCIFFASMSAQSKNHEDTIKKFIDKFKTINNLKFDFVQTNNKLVETGSCFLSYPKKLICRYLGDEQKEVVVNNNTLAIIKRKYRRVYFYKVKNSFFASILDKEKILKQIKNIKDISKQNNLLIITFDNSNKNSSLKLFINRDTLNIAGWETEGYDQQLVSFAIKNTKINPNIIEKFEIPNFDLNGNEN